MHQSIADAIKYTGTVIRDWLTPFYTLGAVVTFAIGILTLLDEGGTLHLTRWVGAALLIATFLTWALHFYQQHKHKATSDAPETAHAKLHIVLLIISSFFTVGILVSEAFMKGHRQQLQTASNGLQAPAPAPTPTAAAPQPLPASIPVVVPVPVPAPTTVAAVEPVVAPSTLNSSTTPTAPVATATSSPERPVAVTPKPIVSANKSHTVLATAPNASQAQRKPVPKNSEPRVQDARCTALISSFSLGQDLSESQQQYLEKCR